MIKYFPDLIQGTDEWFKARLGLLTASEMKHVITPTMKAANNDKSRGHVYELLAQRITQYVEPSYVSDDMLRGQSDEIEAAQLYNSQIAPCHSMGFVTNDKWGFTIGYSPDALVGNDGLIECKCRKQKYQIETVITKEMPVEYMIQVQTGMMVSERPWCDFISYSGGLPMFVKRIHADEKIQDAIMDAAAFTEGTIRDMMQKYGELSADLLPTERKVYEEMVI